MCELARLQFFGDQWECMKKFNLCLHNSNGGKLTTLLEGGDHFSSFSDIDVNVLNLKKTRDWKWE